jgi:hypothetical protein
MVKNANAAPQLEELPVSDRAAELIHAVNGVHFASQLRKIDSRKLFQDVRRGAISMSERDIIIAEKEARRKQLVVSSEQPPETLPEIVVPAPEGTWSPTQTLEAIPPREYDARERAAGEHLDR